jgi:hypothetical protein
MKGELATSVRSLCQTASHLDGDSTTVKVAGPIIMHELAVCCQKAG